MGLAIVFLERGRHKMTPKITAENAAETVRYIITEYYKLNAEPFFSVLSKNCVWILPGGQTVIGAEAIRGFFGGRHPFS